LSLGLEALFIIVTVSCLASSAISTGGDCTAFSTFHPSYHSHLPTSEDGTDTVFRNVGL
jgi:hypothetical protein